MAQAPIAPDTIYTKTAKGILEVKNKAVKLPRELGLIFLSVDGRATVADLQPRSGMTPAQLQHALHMLVTDGYIKMVSHGQQAAVDTDNVDFTQKQVIASVNAEAASHALAAADAVKRAQAEAKAALEARLRQEAEARACTLAETRAAAESEARVKAVEAARAAGEERAKAEREASAAADPAARAEAEAHARSAAAAVVRAEAEVRVRAEAEERARVQAEEKRAAAEAAAKEAETHAKSEEQAHARAAAEGRAREAFEAQLQAMESMTAIADATSPEAEAARARVRQMENAAEHAREAAREIAESEGRADEIPQPEMDIAERVRQLHARVAAQRQSHVEAPAPDPLAVEFESPLSAPGINRESAALKLGLVETSAPPPDDLPMVVIPTDDEPIRAETPREYSPAESFALPVVDLDRADRPPAPQTPEHVPTALERAMTELAARQQTRKEEPEPQQKPPPDPAARTQPIVLNIPIQPEADSEKPMPTIEGDDEPFVERLNLDRTSHDAIAETVEARRKAEAAMLSRDALEARRKRADEEARRSAAAEQQKKRSKAVRWAIAAAVGVPALGIAWLQFADMNGSIPAAQNAISQRLNQPVTIQNLRYVLLPTPRLMLEDVWIGKGQGVKVRRVVARVQPFAALAGPESFDTVEAEGVEIDSGILATIPKWTGGRPADTIHVNTLRISELKLNLPGGGLGTYDGIVSFASNGTVKDAAFQSEKARVTLTPQAEGVRVTLEATGWQVPYGPPIEFDRFKLSGLIDQNQVAAAEFTGTLAAGALEGAITARWAGPVAVQGEFKLQNARVLDLTRELTPNFAARGTLRANGRFSMQGADWSAVSAHPQLEASFAVTRGELTNIDLVRAIQSAAPGAIRGGRTAFEELSGVLQMSGDRVAFRQLQMTSGALNASGTVDVSAQGQLSGRFNAQLASGAGGVVARSSLGVTGTVADPNLTR